MKRKLWIVRASAFPSDLSSFSVETNEDTTILYGSRLDSIWSNGAKEKAIATLQDTKDGHLISFGKKRVHLDYAQIQELVVLYLAHSQQDCHKGLTISDFDFDDRPEKS